MARVHCITWKGLQMGATQMIGKLMVPFYHVSCHPIMLPKMAQRQAPHISFLAQHKAYAWVSVANELCVIPCLAQH